MKKVINYGGVKFSLLALAVLLAMVIAPLQSLAANLLVNGGFEEPAVSNGGWGVFPSGDVPGWDVEWTDGSVGGTLEFQNPPIAGISDTAEGEQYVELGSDGKADASVTILQSVDTCAGGEYELSFAWQPRPAGLNTHLMNAYVDGDLVGSYSTASDSYDAGEWNLESHTFEGTGGAVEIVFEEAGSADTVGMLLDGVSVELAEETCDSDVPKSEITSPEVDEEFYVGDLVTFAATYSDNDPQGVDWAVRAGTCAAGQGTVYGNVDGYSNAYDWDGSLFESIADTSGWEIGTYCFVFNPREERDEPNIRLTRQFELLDPDPDNDGVLVEADMCEGTKADTPGDELGTNRWAWDSEAWMTKMPVENGKGKGKANGPDFSPTIEGTYGCGCTQILGWLNDYDSELYGEMNGHYKFGCSKSVLEDFMTLNME